MSRQQLHAIEVPASFETGRSFDVMLVNHGESLHVHLHLDDTLSEVASIDASNHFVEGNSQRAVRITVDTDRLPDDGLFGRLKVASAYGAETRWIDIELKPPANERTSVEVDESLSKPQPRKTDDNSESSPSRPALPVLALGGVALLTAILTALLVKNMLVTLGALVVLAGVVVAAYFLFLE
ncbi:DUF7524 family protein [Salinibaculum rarum]|uniref:DUF7524 family protein n=1 Tax=Salinibaculum rarum TaxID=3058903 RepID=UPI00265F6C69|nr:hypothetical protein [Salinibaculum sp. KK48]